MPTNSHTIICLSSQSWGEGMWTNKQHVMSRLARAHRVIHVDFGLCSLPGYLYQRGRHCPRALLHPLELWTDGVMPQGGNLYVANGWALPGLSLLPKGQLLRDFFEYDAKVLMLRRFLDQQQITDPIIWVYHPGYEQALERLPRKLLVYDCVDDYGTFPNYRRHANWIRQREQRLCRKADLVFATSEALFTSKRAYNPENTYLVHNVGDAEHFKQAQDPTLGTPPELARLPRPIIGFIGAISNYKLNVDWILAAAQKEPSWSFVLIGPVGLADRATKVRALRRASNIHLFGHRPYASLPRYLRGFDVATIPYRLTEHTTSVFPIKFFEYLATGKPVVISNLPALREYYSWVHVAADAEQFVTCCAAALVQGERDKQKRIALAEENSWPKRVGQMLELVENKLESKKS